MPNRIIKDSICTSDTVNSLSDKAEILFYRLIVQCDDYGLFDGRTSIIRTKCFPLKVDDVKEKDIEKWLGELVKAGMLWFYEVDGKRYMKMASWSSHQQLRARHSKYPQPSEDDISGNHMKSDDIKCWPEIESESESESEIEIEIESETEKERIPYDDICDLWNKIVTDLPTVRSVTQSRKKAIKAIWHRENQDVSVFEHAFYDVQESDFLCGRTDKPWGGCGFDWVMKPANWLKITEGNYKNKRVMSEAERIYGL